MKNLLTVCLCLLFVVFVNGKVEAAAPVIKWDMPNEYGETSLAAETDKLFIEKLSELSGGRIQITYHAGGALGYKTAQHFDSVGDGAIPLASSFMAPLRGVDRIFSLVSLPFLCQNIQESRFLFEIARPYFTELFKKNNQIILYVSPWPACGIWSKKPIKEPSDLKNLRIRVYDPESTKAFSDAGATSIQLTWADIVPQLSTGGIDSVLTSAEGGVFSKFWDFLKYYTELNYISPLMIVHMNATKFNNLPKDLQEAVMYAAGFAQEYAWTKVHTRAEKNYADLQKNGVTVTKEISPELRTYLVKSGERAIEEWVKGMGEKGAQILDEFKKRVE